MHYKHYAKPEEAGDETGSTVKYGEIGMETARQTSSS